MNDFDVIVLGLGIERPWRIVGQILDRDIEPHVLHIKIKAERGANFSCPVCGRFCKEHDFHELTRRHLNFFRYHCYIKCFSAQDHVCLAWGENVREYQHDGEMTTQMPDQKV